MTAAPTADGSLAVTLTTDQHRRVRSAFDDVLHVAAGAREDFLERACGDDPIVHARVARLLALHLEAESFLEHPLATPMPADAGEFTDTTRFAVRRRLGAGGMGVVYEVHDRERDELVALKTLLRTGTGTLSRLKQEFRQLADVSHPNLVCLYELFVDEARSFFTMELIDGVMFVDYVRAGGQPSMTRLRPALRQLAQGVTALHRRGKLHRDIKPSNVLVTAEGRVVILDFGLIADALPRRAGDARYVSAGTPAYMAPEESTGTRPVAASDWYGVGVTLYEALTGSVPFDGSVSDVLARKRQEDPRPPAVLCAGTPADLDALCVQLLSREPARRLDAAAALLALDGAGAEPISVVRETDAHDLPFIGRRRELDALHATATAVTPDRGGAVVVYGASGIGKTALIRQFLTAIGGDERTVVLTGRCYENESVPFKALDGVVDALSRCLASMSSQEIDAVLTPDVVAVTRLFPVLLDVPAIADATRSAEPEPVEPVQMRRRAVGALSGVLARMASRAPLVVWIDDLQWADADSTRLLEELLAPPGAAGMLTLLSFRSEEVAGNPYLRALVERGGHGGWTTLQVEPMTPADASALAAGLLTDAPGAPSSEVSWLTAEAGGSPFILEQLAHYVATAPPHAGSVPAFAEMLAMRLASLPAEARQFLETLALCARPMAPEVVCDACGVGRDRQTLVAALRSSRFIRSRGSSAQVETYHDRIREALAAAVDAEWRRRMHGRLAEALIDRRIDDCEALFEHHRGAGDFERASVQAGVAAEKAGAALAFDRAASFYEHALALAPASPRVGAWRDAFATALANAGRPADAAAAYLAAAAGASLDRRVELRRRAAEQYLVGGHIDQGLELIRDVLQSVGVRFPRSPRAAMASLIWRRARLAMRGLSFETRPAGVADADTLFRIDTCWAAATGLALVDLITASDFAARHLHLALDAGEPSRVARGLALESAARHADWQTRASGARLFPRARPLAASVGTPNAIAMERLSDGMAAVATGQWRRALDSSQRAVAILREECVGVTWEMTIAQNVLIWSLMYLGELADLSRRVPDLLADAQRRNNLYLATELQTRSNFVWLAADDPDGGEREVVEAVARWSQKGFHRQHYSAMLARMQTALYRGNPRAAWDVMTGSDERLRGSMLLRVQALRTETNYMWGRSALAVAAADPSAHRLLAVARARARQIASERMHWSTPIARLLEAGIAYVGGEREAAITLLEAALEQFERAHMGLYAAVARRRLGELRGDARGRALLDTAETWMISQGIRNRVALTRMLAPGFPDASNRVT